MAILYKVNTQVTAKWPFVITATTVASILIVILRPTYETDMQAAATASHKGSLFLKFSPESETVQHLIWSITNNLQTNDRYTHQIHYNTKTILVAHLKDDCHLPIMCFIHNIEYNHHIITNQILPVKPTFDVRVATFFDDNMQIYPTNSQDAEKSQITQNVVLYFPAHGEKTLRIKPHEGNTNTHHYAVLLASTAAIVQNDTNNKTKRGKTTNVESEYNLTNSCVETSSDLLFLTYGLLYNHFSFHQNPRTIHKYKLVETTSKVIIIYYSSIAHNYLTKNNNKDTSIHNGGTK